MTSEPESLLGRLVEDAASVGLDGIRRGIEKESLRVAPNGALAQTSHPASLGSALTHPHITTDFSEALIELITDPETDVAQTLGQLEEIHAWVYRQIGEEILWSASMPCVLRGDDHIPLGRYGNSNVGTAKTVYRRGLGHRYGRTMQTIAGIHYNFSVPQRFWEWLAAESGWTGDVQEFASQRYFDLIRNFRRTSWLLMYLFGASPAVCKSFLAGREHSLESFDEGSVYLPHATTLRMGNLGYQSDAQSTLQVSYNCLASYARSLQDALTRPWPEYEAIGLERDGVFQQLSTSLLQIENEFYGTIRPKRTTIGPHERPLHALGMRGVEYIEVRCMDVNPFLPLGIDSETIEFLDAFLLHCLLTDSPPDTPEEIAVLQGNRTAIVERGREPGLVLESPTGPRSVAEWGHAILDDCAHSAAALDSIHGGDAAARALAVQRARLDDPSRTPSARILDRMSRERVPFFRVAMDASQQHADYFRAVPLADDVATRLARESRESLDKQAEIEAADTVDFATYRRQFIDQPLIPGVAAD